MMNKLITSLFVVMLAGSTHAADATPASPVIGNELLVNGNFEQGVPAEENSSSFSCLGWRRLLWKPGLIKSYLTDAKQDPVVEKNNKALKFLWDGTSICQYFSAEAGQSYAFSVDTFNPAKADSRWQPRIQVQWYDENNKAVGAPVTVAQTDNAKALPGQWNPLGGSATAPAGTAYGRLLLNVNSRGSGQMWVSTYLDNASAKGKPGTHNLPVSFTGSPYPMTLPAIPESTPSKDSLTRYAEDKDGDTLTFIKISGPAWLNLEPNGTLTGTPAFTNAGDNTLVVKVSDERGSTDTQTLTIPVVGQLRLANLFNDNMVLQREQPLKVWGHAVPDSPIRAEISTGEHVETTSDATGAWLVTLPALKPSMNSPLTLTVKSGDRTLILKNLLVGDVWLCSGQSNMALALEGADGSQAAIAAANHPALRLLRNPVTKSQTPWTELLARARWDVCSPATVKEFSAVAYYFGKKLIQETGIPIGLISANQGGTRIELWSGGDLYNARIHPYTRLPIKGVIWYQGEANINDGAAYTDKLRKMVIDWRAVWGLGAFPFFFVQVAPFKYDTASLCQLAELWEAQTKAMELIPNSGMVVINDIGNIEDIHPRNKAPVGERLARWALNKTYGHPEIACSGPVVRAVLAEGQRLRITFDHSDGLAARDGKPLSWFEVAGADETYVKADAVLDGESVLVSAQSVPNPVWVRFAWNNKAEPNLINREGLPAAAFRMKTHEFNKQGTPTGLSGGALRAADDILIADFEADSYGDWKAEGTAFGTKPSDNKIATQLGFKGFSGKGLAQSFAGRDTKPTGTLTSPEFTVERDYINMLIGGGANKHKVGAKILVEGKEVGRITGEKSLFLDSAGISVKAYRGKKAVVVVYDQDPGWWGYIAVDDIWQSDQKVGYERVEKKIIITGKCLLFPIARCGNSRNVLIENEGGVKLHSLRTCLAMTKEEIAWWGYLEVDDYIGKTVTVSVEQRIGTSVLDLIECADEPRFLQPKYDEPLRPQFHFSQLTGWNNDPNGLLWADGFYHIFWQCNPLGTAWGNMYWGHAKSSDLVHWTEMKRAVRSGPADGTPDNLRHPSMAAGACFSGGGNVDVNNTAGWKTGDKDVQFLLVSDMSRGQSIAYSTDGGENFTFYDKNPVFKPSGNDGKPVWYAPGQHWVVVVFEKSQELGEYIGIWTSRNLKVWERQSIVKGFHECPELFELPVDGNANNKKWVICGATMDYLVGSFDGKTFTPDSGEKRTMLTEEHVYAGQTFSQAPGGHVIYTAWAKVDMGDAPFNQGFAIPMELTLKTVKRGQVNLFANPVKEIESLREPAVVNIENAALNSANPGISKELPGQLYDVCLTLQKKGNPKEASITIGRTTISYNFEAETCGGKPAPMSGDKVDIRILIDRPTAEIFSAGGYSYELMKRSDGGKNVGRITVKSNAPQGSGVVVENLTVYPMKSIWKK